jgi:hypothetical protein
MQWGVKEKLPKQLLKRVAIMYWLLKQIKEISIKMLFNYSQDKVQNYQGYSAENLAVIRHLGINLLSRDKKTKVGMKTKRLKAGWDNNYLKDTLTALNIVTV